MAGFTQDSIRQSILEGWASEGFIEQGYLAKFANGIAKGIYKELTTHVSGTKHVCSAADVYVEPAPPPSSHP